MKETLSALRSAPPMEKFLYSAMGFCLLALLSTALSDCSAAKNGINQIVDQINSAMTDVLNGFE